MELPRGCTVRFWLFMSPTQRVASVRNNLLTLGSSNCLKLVLQGHRTTFFLYCLLFCPSFLLLTLVSLLHVRISLFGRNQPSEDFFFFCLLNSLGAEALVNWELNGEKSQAWRFVHEMDFFVPLRICCKQI